MRSNEFKKNLIISRIAVFIIIVIICLFDKSTIPSTAVEVAGKNFKK